MTGQGPFSSYPHRRPHGRQRNQVPGNASHPLVEQHFERQILYLVTVSGLGRGISCFILKVEKQTIRRNNEVCRVLRPVGKRDAADNRIIIDNFRAQFYFHADIKSLLT